MGLPQEFGRTLIVAGVVIAVLGVLLTLSGRIPVPGRLPGDIVVSRRNFTLYLPVASSLLLSLLLSLVFWLLRR